MKAKNVTIQELEKALKILNKSYDNNIVFKRLEPVGRQVLFTLTVKSSKGKGGRIGMNGRRIAAACWHVHGNLFDILIGLNPKAIITSCKSTISASGGNWRDSNIGSMMQPLMFSDACECGNH